MNIINLPIEPLEERYSAQWDEWFRVAFQHYQCDVRTIYGEQVGAVIERGAFLDVVDTNLYKTTQLQRLIEILRWYDDKEPLVLFFHDLWFPGLETVAYIRDGLGLKNLRICGCLHAGTYDSNDFLAQRGMAQWAQHTEHAWFAHIVDQIYVATMYHKRLVCQSRKISPSKVYVTGFPLYPTFVPDGVSKENLVVFPHRLDPEKQPYLFDALRDAFVGSGWEFIKTKEVIKTKAEYYHLLSLAKFAVSFAKQETWGIAMQEATLCGAIPLCPGRLSYSELYWPGFLYVDFDELVRSLHYFMQEWPGPQFIGDALVRQQQSIKREGAAAIGKMIALMQKEENHAA